VDDPYGPRDLRTWRLYLNAVPEYDAVFVVRDVNVPEARANGAKRVYRSSVAADEVAHAPIPLTDEERKSWASEVLFVGTWMPERGPFLSRLVELGVPLSIHGNHWRKAKEWPVLRSAWRGPGLHSGNDYLKALLGAKVCLGLLSKGNRDQSTQRSFEIPCAGRAFCGERTPEHTSLYTEGEEAEFWSTPEECAEKCRVLLANDRRREELAARGHARCMRNGRLNEPVMAKLLDNALEEAHPVRQERVTACQ
jgi:spore maturation protein CgeB